MIFNSVLLSVCLALASGAEGAATPNASPVYTQKTKLRIPIQLSDEQRANLQAIRLFVSRNEGKSWGRYRQVDASEKAIPVEMTSEGVYWFNIALVDQSGTQTPPDFEKVEPGLMVVIDRTAPAMMLKPVKTRSGRRGVRWEITEKHPDPNSLRLAVWQNADFGWVPYPVSDPKRQIVWFPSEEPVRKIQATVKDLAGNETIYEVEVLGDRFAKSRPTTFALEEKPSIPAPHLAGELAATPVVDPRAEVPSELVTSMEPAGPIGADSVDEPAGPIAMPPAVEPGEPAVVHKPARPIAHPDMPSRPVILPPRIPTAQKPEPMVVDTGAEPKTEPSMPLSPAHQPIASVDPAPAIVAPTDVVPKAPVLAPPVDVAAVPVAAKESGIAHSEPAPAPVEKQVVPAPAAMPMTTADAPAPEPSAGPTVVQRPNEPAPLAEPAPFPKPLAAEPMTPAPVVMDDLESAVTAREPIAPPTTLEPSAPVESPKPVEPAVAKSEGVEKPVEPMAIKSEPVEQTRRPTPVEPAVAKNEPIKRPAPPVSTTSSRKIVIHYALGEHRPEQIEQVALWATPDQGENWLKVAVDTDKVPPIEATLPTVGQWGLHLAITAGGAESTPDRHTPPDVYVQVSAAKPAPLAAAPSASSDPLAGRLPALPDARAEPEPAPLAESDFAPAMHEPAVPQAPALPPVPPEQISFTRSSRVSIQYNLGGHRPDQIREVSLWGTRDQGRTWTRLSADADKTPPIEAELADGEVWGLGLVIVGNHGGISGPSAGSKPDVYVQLDGAEPFVALGVEDVADGVVVFQWKAEDANLTDEPIALYFASDPNGPWKKLAGPMPNNGHYAWHYRADGVAGHYFFRIEAHDRAGNTGAAQTLLETALEK